MLAIGMALGPIVGGNPLLSLAAGAVMAVVTAGGFALVQRLRARRRPVVAGTAVEATLVVGVPALVPELAPAFVTP